MSRTLAKSFTWLGWVAFWTQLVLGVIPVLLLLFALISKKFVANETGTVVELSLAYACSLFVIFAVLWSYRYTRLGREFDRSEVRLLRVRVVRTLRIGLIGNLVGMTSSTLVAMSGVGIMLLNLLSQPQGAIPIGEAAVGIGPSGIGSGPWITPIDLMWLQASLNNIAAQLIGVGIALFLLHRANTSRLGM